MKSWGRSQHWRGRPTREKLQATENWNQRRRWKQRKSSHAPGSAWLAVWKWPRYSQYDPFKHARDRGWRAGPASILIQRTQVLSPAPAWHSSHPSVTPVLRDPVSFPGLHEACVWCTGVHAGKIPSIHTIKKKSSDILQRTKKNNTNIHMETQNTTHSQSHPKY